jgi:hypothetical protein
VQRCQVHEQRNVLEHLPQNLRPSVVQALRQAWDATSAELARRQLERLPASLECDHPGAAASIREGIGGQRSVAGSGMLPISIDHAPWTILTGVALDEPDSGGTTDCFHSKAPTTFNCVVETAKGLLHTWPGDTNWIFAGGVLVPEIDGRRGGCRAGSGTILRRSLLSCARRRLEVAVIFVVWRGGAFTRGCDRRLVVAARARAPGISRRAPTRRARSGAHLAHRERSDWGS